MSPVRARHLAWSLAALALAIEIAYYVIVLAAATYEFAFFNLLRSVFVLVFATLGRSWRRGSRATGSAGSSSASR